jgi:GT2 family glycosyltransferase
MPDFDLSITICSWNTIVDLRDCLQSLREAKGEADFEVVVVDNASVDGSPDMVEKEFPEFRLLRQTVNLGFTGGHNLALKERKGRDAALLNSDTVVHPGAIRKLSEFMKDRPDVGIVGPKLLNPDGSLQFSCRRWPDPMAAIYRNTFIGKLFPGNRAARDYLMQEWDHNDTREVDWVSGAAMFLRAELLDKIGGLDNTLFMYCEDTDICRRAWNAGFKVMYLHDAVITHAIGRSTDRVANKMIIRHHRSMFRYYRKHTVREQFILLRPLMLAFGAAGLTLRAGAALGKNQRDALRRRLKR